MIFTLAFYTNPIKRKQTLTESERNEDHEMEIGLRRSYDGIIRNSMRQ